MLLELLSRILLWVAVGLIIWFILVRFIPRNYLTWFGGLVVLALLVVSFIDTASPAVASIWRILSFPLYPLGAAVSLLAVSIYGGPKQKATWSQVTWALVILFFASLPLVGRYLVGQAEGSVQDAFDARRTLCEEVCPAIIPEQSDLNDVLAVVVMGDSVDAVRQTVESPTQVDSSRDFNVSFEPRLIYSSILYNELRARGSAPQMYVTAGPTLGNDEEKADKTKALKQVLFYGGIRETDPNSENDDVVRVLDTGMAARPTAEQVKSSLEEQNLLTDADDPTPQENRIMLVAPALSIRRTALTFEQLDLNVIARPTDFYSQGGQRSNDLLVQLSDVIPSVDGLRLTTRWWDEFLTTIYYFLRGWLPSFNVSWQEVVEI
ncbi:MAG: hypothetical protein AAFW84_02255 [Cyanobacteria bacterium J06635_15]